MENEKQTQMAVTIPLFLKKLWKMVNDKEAEDIIGWNSAGDGFIIYDQLQFITKLLPQYFKHNNMASFIRQLNFYDFHKIAGIDKEEIHFSHNCFLRDLPETLVFIKRKCTSVKSKLANHTKEEEMAEVLNGVKELKTKHALVDNELKLLKQENAALWSEINNLRIKHSKQTKIINKIIHFLISYMHSQNSLSKRNGVINRKSTQKNIKTGPTILEIGYHNPYGDISKQTKENSFNVAETSDVIDQNLGNENVSDLISTDDNSLNELLNTAEGTAQADPQFHIKKLMRAYTAEKRKFNAKSSNVGVQKHDFIDNMALNTLEPESPNTTHNQVPNALVIPKSNILDTSTPTTSNPKNIVGTSKMTQTPIEHYDSYISNSIDPLVPTKPPPKYKILENPKENLGLYLNNTQMEINSLHDMLSNLSSAELTNFCDLMESAESEAAVDNLKKDTSERSLPNINPRIKIEQLGIGTEASNDYVNRETLPDELSVLPVESYASELSNENDFQNDQLNGELIPEVLVDEYFNTDF